MFFCSFFFSLYSLLFFSSFVFTSTLSKISHCYFCNFVLNISVDFILDIRNYPKLKYLYSHRFGECSQICNVKTDGNHTCSCTPGYSHNSYSQKRQKSCSADGHLAYMIVANDNFLQKLSPYKHGNSAETLPLTTV